MLNQSVTSNFPSKALSLFITGFVIILLVKLFFAFALDLYSDEIFYWQASTYPAIAYSDLPFMAALLAGVGNTLFGNSAFAIRSMFLLLGSAIPFLVLWIARPILPRQQAFQAAALSLCLPLCGFLGLLAVPDVPLLFIGLVFIGAFERATRLELNQYWLATGIAAALGVSTHYRFALYLLAAFTYLLVFPSMRRHWKSPGLWIAAGILLIGLYPTLSFNFSNDLSGIDYHLLERHPWEFQAEGLLHTLKQAILVTPLLYIALLFTLYRLCVAARAGDTSKGLFALFAACNLGVYLVLAPWTDSTRTSIHWPLSGYLPLLIFLPETLQVSKDYITNKFNAQIAHRLLVVTVAIGFTGSVVALAGLGSQAFHEQLRPLVGGGVLSNKMAGWKDFAGYVEELITTQQINDDEIIVTDNYYTAAQLALALRAPIEIFNIDQDKAIRDGRAVQYQMWQHNASALATRPQISGLFITEDSTLTVPDKIAIVQRACDQFPQLTYLSQLSLLSGDKKFSFYRGETTSTADTSSTCPKPTLGWLDLPQNNAVVSTNIDISGWVVNEGLGVASVEVLLNEKVIAIAQYGVSRPDVAAAMNVQSDPNAPNLGFEASIATSSLPKGKGILSVKVVGVSGEEQYFGAREVDLR